MIRDADMAVHSSSILKLSSSDEFSMIVNGVFNDPMEAQKAHYVRDFLKKVTSLNVPPSFWFFGRNHCSLLFFLLNQRHSHASIKLLLEAGVSVWPTTYTTCDSAVFVPSFMKPSEVSLFIFSTHDYSLRRCKACLLGALSGLASTPTGYPLVFFTALMNDYVQATRPSSVMSLGVLGPADKRAKACAVLVTDHAESLRTTCALLCPDASSRLESIIVDAARRLAFKFSKEVVVWSPEVFKKSLTAVQYSRLHTLSTLLDTCFKDEVAFDVMMASTPWLVAFPHALSVSRRSAHSLVHTALSTHASHALNAFDHLGANIWLASAQAGEANACLWSVATLSQHIPYYKKDEVLIQVHACLPVISRMLVYGAHLDGAANPVDHALLKTQAAIDVFTSTLFVRKGISEDVALSSFSALRSHVESLVLSELLSGHALVSLSAPSPLRRHRL